MSCGCRHPHDCGQYMPRTDTSDNEDNEYPRYSSHRNKCPALNDQAWSALSSLREKTCQMFTSGSEGAGTETSGKCQYAEPRLEDTNILRKANDLINYVPESEFLKKMKQQCQYLQSNQSNIFSALDEGIDDECFDYHKQKAQPAQRVAPNYDYPNNENFMRFNYDVNPRMDYMDYNDMHLNPFSFELECNAQNMQPQPVVEVSYIEQQCQAEENEKKKSEHVSRSRKPVKCRGLRKRKSGNAGKCESENQFEPTLKKPHENSCHRCWRFASPSRSPVNKPDQKYDPNYRRGHSRTDFERGDGNLGGRGSYTSPCIDSESFIKEISPAPFSPRSSPAKVKYPPKPATAPEHPQSPTSRCSPPSKDMQYNRGQSTSPPRHAQNYPAGCPSFPMFEDGQKCSPNLPLPVGISKTIVDYPLRVTEAFPVSLSSVPAMSRSPTGQTCPGLSVSFPVTKPSRSVANCLTEPPSFLSAKSRPPCARSTSPENRRGSMEPTAALPSCLSGSPGVQSSSPKNVPQNYSSSRSPSPNKTKQNYSGPSSVPRCMQNSSGAQLSLPPNARPRSPVVQSPSRGMENLQNTQPSRACFSGSPSSSVPGSVPRPSCSSKPIENNFSAAPYLTARPITVSSPRSSQVSPKAVNQRCVQFQQSPPRATDRIDQNFNTCNQPCPAVPQGSIYSASGRKERPKSFIPDLGGPEMNRCYHENDEFDVTEYKIIAPTAKNQVYQRSLIHSCGMSDSNAAGYNKSSPRDQTCEVPAVPHPPPKCPSTRQSPGQSTGQSPGQFTGQSTGQSTGQFAGQSTGQFAGQSTGQFAGQSTGQSPGQSTGQSPGQSTGQSPGRLESIPEGKSTGSRGSKSKSPRRSSNSSSSKLHSPSQGKTGTSKGKSSERSGSGQKKGKTKPASPKPGTSKAKDSKSPGKSTQKSDKSSPRKCNTASENQRGGSQIVKPSQEYHCGSKVSAEKAKEWYFDSDHPLRECSCYPRMPIFTNDPDNYQGGRIFCCHCDWNKSGGQQRPGSGEMRTPTKPGSCNCSRQTTPKEFDGVAFPCPYRRSSESSGQAPTDRGSVQQRSKPSPQQQQGPGPSPKQQQNPSSNPANCPPRKYVVYYMTTGREKKKDENDVEVLVEEFSQCPKEIDSRTNDITEKMKRIMDCPSDSMALRFQKGVSESSKTPPSSRILYF